MRGQIPGAALSKVEVTLGVNFHPWQNEAFDHAFKLAHDQPLERQRMCLYYKTGSGKTITALVALWFMGHNDAVVITPPSTYAAWQEKAALLDMEIECMSHAKFRDKGTKLSRHKPVIGDEFHLFGGHGGKGWAKFDRLSMGLQAPLIIASATPNYNDAERVYCIEHVLDPVGTKGGYLEFLYRNCTTEFNPYGQEPIVTGFQNFAEAKDYLAALPNVLYLPDDLVYTIEEDTLGAFYSSALDDYGYSERQNKMIASQIGEKHERIALNFMGVRGSELNPKVQTYLRHHLSRYSTLLLYCTHETVAKAVFQWMEYEGYGCALVTGKTPLKKKAATIAEFCAGRIKTLIGTATLGTGTDGMDKVCDRLIILDDTEDDAFRRQLIGRIMPRDGSADASSKEVRRLNFI